MKKYNYLLLIIASLSVVFLISHFPVHGQEEGTDSATTTIPEERLEKIRKLKDRVATRVAELRKEKTPQDIIGGQIKKRDGSTLTIKTSDGEATVTTTDDTDITFSNGVQKKSVINAIKPGQMLLAVGTGLNASFSASLLIIHPTRIFLDGKISSIDRPVGQFVLASSGTSTTIDVKRSTRTNKYDENKGIIRSGFSKLKIGDTIHVVGAPTKETELVEAIRVLIIPLSTTPTSTPTPNQQKTSTKKPTNNIISPTPES